MINNYHKNKEGINNVNNKKLKKIINIYMNKRLIIKSTLLDFLCVIIKTPLII